MLTTVRPSRHAVERLGEHLLRLRVDRRGRLVEDQQARIAELGTGERDELALAHGQVRAALAHGRVEPAGQVVEPPAEAERR